MLSVKVKIVTRNEEGDKVEKEITVGKSAYEQFMKDEHPYYKGSKIVEEFESDAQAEVDPEDKVTKEDYEKTVAEKDAEIERLKAELAKSNAEAKKGKEAAKPAAAPQSPGPAVPPAGDQQ